MPHDAVFHQDLHCMQKYPFMVSGTQRVKLINNYGKCVKISNTFFLFSNKMGYRGWKSQNACLNSKQGRSIRSLVLKSGSVCSN